jgi:hypothetical protein
MFLPIPIPIRKFSAQQFFATCSMRFFYFQQANQLLISKVLHASFCGRIRRKFCHLIFYDGRDDPGGVC